MQAIRVSTGLAYASSRHFCSGRAVASSASTLASICGSATAVGFTRNQRDTYIGVDYGAFGRRPKPGIAGHVIRVRSNSVGSSTADIGRTGSLWEDDPVMLHFEVIPPTQQQPQAVPRHQEYADKDQGNR